MNGFGHNETEDIQPATPLTISDQARLSKFDRLFYNKKVFSGKKDQIIHYLIRGMIKERRILIYIKTFDL